MARPEKILSARGAAAISKTGRHADGGGLYLYCKDGSQSWAYMFAWGGRQREMGLGAFPTVSLAKARELRDKWRMVLLDGQNPIEVRKAGRSPVVVKTFGQCATALIASKASGWRNEKHKAQWETTLQTYAASLYGRPVSDVGTEHIKSVLKPLWGRIPETARRVRARIESVLDFAKSNGWRSGENPAAWRGHLDHQFPQRQRLERAHFMAMPYADLPGFIGRLHEYQADSIAALALEFAILTACRSGEVLGATWSEFNLGSAVWTVPGQRTKSGRVHQVPLVSRTVAILESMQAIKTGDYVFPGQRRGRPLSPSAMSAVLGRLKVEGASVHGFRSSFRDFAANETGFAREVAEAALAHRTGDNTELAYKRTDFLGRRRELMAIWAAYCAPAAQGQGVLQFLSVAQDMSGLGSARSVR